MPPILVLALGLLLASTAATTVGAAQEWRPPGREMPTMPEMSELSGSWLASRSAWFADLAEVTGVAPAALEAVGEAARGSTQAQVVRFNSGPFPTVVWADRNGDGRADMIEIYRTGRLLAQVIDADYDGLANVLRAYDAAGMLLREERL